MMYQAVKVRQDGKELVMWLPRDAKVRPGDVVTLDGHEESGVVAQILPVVRQSTPEWWMDWKCAL